MQLRKYRSTAKIIVISGGVRAYAADFLEISKSLGASKVLAKFVSGYAEQAIVRGEFLDAGMNMLTKPFALETLGAKVNSVIRPPSADPD